MAALWTKNADGDWVQSHMYAAIATSSGSTSWRNASKIYEKTATSTWTLRYDRPITFPPAPIIAVTSMNATTKKATFSITMPSWPTINRVVIKMSSVQYPASSSAATDPTGVFYTRIAADGTTWSQRDVVANQVVIREMDSLVANDTYFISAWAFDSNGNVSLPGKATFKFPALTVPSPAPVVKTAYISCTDSASWLSTDNFWRTDNNYVYQGGRDSYGMWFYSTAFQTTLAKATKILDVNIGIGRVNSAHGVAGQANVRLSTHKWPYQPPGAADGSMFGGSLVGTLGRGEYKWFDVPSAWWPLLKTGGVRGFGLRFGSTSFTDPDYLIAYGKGTNGGKIFLKWEE